MADDQPLPQIEYPYAARVVTPAGQFEPPSAEPDTAEDHKGTSLGPALVSRYAWLLGALWALAAAIVNFVAVPFSEELGGPSGWDFLVALGLGLIGSQMLVLSGALVWSNRPFLLRLVVLWLVAMALYGCWYLGVEIAIGSDEWSREYKMQEARAILASLAAVSLAIQVPQWLLRFYFGWTIVRPATDAGIALERQLSIRDFLIGTAVTALTVAPMRLAVEDPRSVTTEFWAGWAIAGAILVAVSAVVNLPLLFLVLRVRQPAWALAFIFFGSPIIGGAVIATIMGLSPGGGPDVWGIAMMLLVTTSCVAATSLPLWLTRLAGYRLALRGVVLPW